MFAKPDSWRVLGTSVKPQDSSWLHLRQNVNVPDWIRNSRQYPGVAQWIGDQAVWKEVPDGVLGGDAGGQRRRLGRLLFAANAERFRAKLLELNASLVGRSKQQGTTYHILCGLAGGTGSGCVVDAAAQISSISSHPDDRIVIYAVLPERAPLPAKKQTYYHANAYAALRELNGVLIGAYKPWDILNGNGPIAVGDKLKSIYLISNENESGYQVHMDDDSDSGGGLSEIVGDYLFQKLVVDPISGRTVSPIETSENSSDLAETFAKGKPARSRRFFSFGINRIAIPEEEIQEYFALSFAAKSANHLQFNNWSELEGWRSEPSPRNFHEEVRRPEARQRWKVTDSHLTYAVPVLARDAGRGWHDSWDMEFESWAAGAVAQVQEAFPTSEWLDQVERQFQLQFEEGYRSQGVTEFYATRLASARAIAQEIRGTVERDLFKAWRNGTYALADLLQLVTALRQDVAARIARIIGEVPALREDVDAAASGMEEVRQRWRKRLIPLRNKSLFEEMRSQCLSYQITNTQIAAANYLEQMAPLLNRELTELETVIQQAQQRVDNAADKLKAGVEARLATNARVAADHMNRIVDGQRVRDAIRDVFLLSRDVQHRLAQTARDALIGDQALGDEPSFQKFIEHWPEGELVSKLEVVSEQAASREHDVANLEEGKKILGVSLLRKLRQEYSGRQEDLVGFIRAATKSAAPFILLDPAQVQASGPEYGLDPTVSREPPRAMLVHYPAAQDMPDFTRLIESAFRDVHSGGAINFSTRADKQNEITIVTVMSSFPARYVDVLRLVYEAYMQLMTDERQARRVKMELHTSDICTELPHLTPETGPPPDVSSYLLLAELLGVVSQSRSAVTGNNQILLHSTDPDDGLPKTQLLGTTLEQAKGALHGDAVATIREELNLKLQQRKHDDEKEALKTRLRAKLQATLDQVQDPQHPEYLEERAAVSGATKLIANGRV